MGGGEERHISRDRRHPDMAGDTLFVNFKLFIEEKRPGVEINQIKYFRLVLYFFKQTRENPTAINY